MKTVVERRIEIIQDAIAQLKAQIYRTGGDYGYLTLPFSIRRQRQSNEDQQAQKFLCDDLSENDFCGVCAKGSLLISTVRKENALTLDRLVDNHGIVMERLTLDGLFNRENLNLLEAYYESWQLYPYETFSGWVLDSGGDYHYCDSDAGIGPSKELMQPIADQHNEKIAEYVSKYPTKDGGERTERLIAILENMIANDGVFEPLK